MNVHQEHPHQLPNITNNLSLQGLKAEQYSSSINFRLFKHIKLKTKSHHTQAHQSLSQQQRTLGFRSQKQSRTLPTSNYRLLRRSKLKPKTTSYQTVT